ncbi:hypothetical protein BH11MYX2_BH11MYX2_27000 [soil metagenome]
MKAVWLLCALAACHGDDDVTVDPTGELEAELSGATDDPANPFFQMPDTNERTCGTCHDGEASWGLASRPPLLRFYDRKLDFDLNGGDNNDMIAFLSSL